MNPVFELMDYEDINDDFCIGTYNGISITMDGSLESFRINDLFKNLTLQVDNARASTSVSHWLNGKVGSILYNDPIYHDLFYKKEGSPKIKGWYAPMVLFNAILYSTNVIKAQKWVMGMMWQEPVEGYIYFIQPSDCIDTQIYKYGMTWNTDQRYVSYSKGKEEMIEFRKVKVLNIVDINWFIPPPSASEYPNHLLWVWNSPPPNS